MKKFIEKATEPHIVFAWLPVLVFDRTTNMAYIVWLEKVERKLVSIQGTPVFIYSSL